MAFFAGFISTKASGVHRIYLKNNLVSWFVFFLDTLEFSGLRTLVTGKALQ
jgi:hypothetical protein